jgi:hypothetical protein
MHQRLKNYETIGCCGIDCGLCPRFYTNGASACPGCGGENFNDKHPPCGFLTCCATKKGLEVCAQCNEYPCKRFENKKLEVDSFVTHQRMISNLGAIKAKGIEQFILEQKIRISLLEYFLGNFDEGRSKSFFCQCCSLLPIEKLIEIRETMHNVEEHYTIKEKNQQLRNLLNQCAALLSIDLKLNNR